LPSNGRLVVDFDAVADGVGISVVDVGTLMLLMLALLLKLLLRILVLLLVMLVLTM